MAEVVWRCWWMAEVVWRCWWMAEVVWRWKVQRCFSGKCRVRYPCISLCKSGTSYWAWWRFGYKKLSTKIAYNKIVISKHAIVLKYKKVLLKIILILIYLFSFLSSILHKLFAKQIGHVFFLI